MDQEMDGTTESNVARFTASEPEVEVSHERDEEHVAKMRSTRKYKLCQLTRRKNIIKELMKDNMYTEELEENRAKYKTLLDAFKDAHLSYHTLLNESDEINESEKWFQSKMCSSNDFIDVVTEWMSGPTTRSDECIALGDSASVIAWRSSKHSSGSNVSSRSRSSSHSAVSSARICAEAEKAAAIAKLKA